MPALKDCLAQPLLPKRKPRIVVNPPFPLQMFSGGHEPSTAISVGPLYPLPAAPAHPNPSTAVPAHPNPLPVATAHPNPFRCAFCPYLSQLSADLRRHTMLKHTGRKPYVCSVCQFGFYKRNDLQRHLHTHIKEKPHKCHRCSKSFIRRDHLQNHLRRARCVPAHPV